MATAQEKKDYLLALVEDSGIDKKDVITVISWLIDHWSELDFGNAVAYLEARLAAQEAAAIALLKQQLIDHGETDPYLYT